MASTAGDHCQNKSKGTSPITATPSGTKASKTGPAAYIPRRVRLAPSGVGTTNATIAETA